MLHVLNIILFAIAFALSVPTLVFCVECLSALLPAPRVQRPSDAARPRIAVLMPAHNEEFGIDASLQSVLPQLLPGDRMLVVADNCSDDTVGVARTRGVEVIERRSELERGKGYALDFGLNHLQSDPPEVVLFMDSDCVLHDGSVEALARQVQVSGRAAQAIYLLTRPLDSHPREAVSALAFLVKNLVRPRGLHRLGLPCLLTGAGMALPWEHARAMRMASGNIVEDLQLGIDLAESGHAPRLCPDAFVTGELPAQRQAAIGQRRRWEHGYLQTAIRTSPRLAIHSIERLSIDLLGYALELSVPPLVLLMLSLAMSAFLCAIAAVVGASWLPAIVLGSGLCGVVGCVALSWFRFGRTRVPAIALLGCPAYLLSKLPMYASFAFERETRWIRTGRANEQATGTGGASAEAGLPSIVLQGIRFSRVTEQQCVDHVLDELDATRGGVLVTPNLDHLRRCRRDPEFASLVSESHVVVADGMPLVWASRLQRTPLPQRVAGSDLISSISAAAAKRGRSIFLLGGSPGAAERAAKVLLDRHPNLIVTGTHCPPMGFQDNPEALSEIIDLLTDAKPDIIYVGLGSPKQEALIHELREWLPRSWWLGVGYSFSFLCGDGRRAPRWMQKFGLEWIHRLLCEPRRLARRYLVDGIPHAARLLVSTTFNGLTDRAAEPMTLPAVSRPKIQQHRTSNRTGNNTGNHTGNHAGHSLESGQIAAAISSSYPHGMGIELSRIPQQFASHRPPMRSDKRNGRIVAFILLNGTLRPTQFHTAINRSILDMPIQDGRRLLGHWQHQAADLAKYEGLEQLAMRVLVDHDSSAPAAAQAHDHCTVSIERDRARYRGTGGLLRDLAEEYDDQDFLLVSNGAQLLTHPLVELVRQLHDTEADISFIAHQDGTPSSVMLIRCQTLRNISQAGYVDLKEQALPGIARQFKVVPVELARTSCLSLRTERDYLAALRWWHFQRSQAAAAESRNATGQFCIVEHGAAVDPSACLQDCVVLRGARIDSNAVVVRSVLCAGSVIAAEETAVDQLVSPRLNSETARVTRVLQASRN